MIIETSHFSAVQRQEFTELQALIKPALLGQEAVVAIWAMMDLVKFIATLPAQHRQRYAIAESVRAVADVIEVGL